MVFSIKKGGIPLSRKKQGIIKKKAPQKPIAYTVSESMGLLEFLLQTLTDKPKSKVKSLLAHRGFTVDGVIRTKYDYALKAGQIVRAVPFVPQDLPQDDRLEILYEDEDLIAINKPAGLLSIASDKEKENTAYHLLMEYVKQKSPNNRVYVVHRLDRDTSGVLMVAKNEKMKRALQDHWNDLVTYRGYMAVVEGVLPEKTGRIVSWLKETTTHLTYSSGIKGDGLEAITNYEVLKENEEFSLLSISLETGRKNQIRVHMKDIGHCIVGDKKYGSTTNPAKRLGLHAQRLEFTHPFSKEKMCLQAQLPKKLAIIVKQSVHQ